MNETEESLPDFNKFTHPARLNSFPILSIAWIVLVGFLVVDLLVVSVFLLTRAPASFPVEQVVTIESGLSANQVANVLEEENVVKSSSLLYFILILFHDPASIKAGAYVFNQTESAFAVASKITNDSPRIDLLPLTFPEGFSVKDYAKIASQELPDFDAEKFFTLASSSEGYLFPDTYNIPPEFTEQELMELQLETYQTKTSNLVLGDNPYGLTDYEILILASIVEREANTEESMRMVAGILLNRLELGMALQADASLEYILDKPLSELTADDLKIDSPYNTYLYPGLPPTPIGNPGLTSIKAVLNPLKTDYYYYLTDENGDFYYAKTYSEHQSNIEKYLR